MLDCGQSWGGILAMEYALKYQQNLKGMVICNMTADFHKYAAYNNKLREELRPSLVDPSSTNQSGRSSEHRPIGIHLVF